MLDRKKMEEMSARLIRALTEPRLEILDELLSEDFEVYYGFNDSKLNRAEALAFFRSYFPKITLRYDDIRCTPSLDGWVQQHVVGSDGPDGQSIRNLHACLVVTVDGDRISRIAEYFDSMQTAGFDASQMRAS